MQKDRGFEQGKLRGDADVVRRYGESHPEAWVDLRFENQPTVRIVALFAGDQLSVHEDALRRLVSYPDQLEVRSSPWPQVRLEEIRAEILEMATSSEPGLFSGWGARQGKVHVSLRADGEHIAARLLERYGAAVDLTVGFLHFPDRRLAHSMAPLVANPKRSKPEPLPEGLRVTTDEDLEVKSGTNLRSAIRVINAGRVEVIVTSNGHLTAPVIDPETNETVGGYSGAQTLPLVRFSAPAGGSVEIPLLVGTASIVGRLGYAVPPGRWAVEISFGFEDKRFFRGGLIPLNIIT